MKNKRSYPDYTGLGYHLDTGADRHLRRKTLVAFTAITTKELPRLSCLALFIDPKSLHGRQPSERGKGAWLFLKPIPLAFDSAFLC